MKQLQLISGATEEDIWQQVAGDLNSNDVFDYQVILNQGGTKILLDIDIDLGGGFEGGFEMTTFSATLKLKDDFRFAMHHENFLDKIGKFLGMEDTLIGYPDFDKELVVKTNNAEKLKTLFADTALQQFFISLTDFTLHIGHRHAAGQTEKEAFLELEFEKGITDTVELRKIYHGFHSLVRALNEQAKGISPL